VTSAPSIIPPEEEERIAAVRRFEVLDTPPDVAFDRITALAARAFSAFGLSDDAGEDKP
jgi:hypothetical protein